MAQRSGMYLLGFVGKGTRRYSLVPGKFQSDGKAHALHKQSPVLSHCSFAEERGGTWYCVRALPAPELFSSNTGETVHCQGFL